MREQQQRRLSRLKKGETSCALDELAQFCSWVLVHCRTGPKRV